MEKPSLVLIAALFLLSMSVAAAHADSLVKDFESLSQEYHRTSAMDLSQAVPLERSLKNVEDDLIERLLKSKQALHDLSRRASSLEAGLLSRLVKRLQFEVVQEGRAELKPMLTTFWSAYKQAPTIDRGKKKIAFISGCEVNLLDGEWNYAPDGRRYWTSNEYPDIVLTAAEYRRYSANAQIVYD